MMLKMEVIRMYKRKMIIMIFVLLLLFGDTAIGENKFITIEEQMEHSKDIELSALVGEAPNITRIQQTVYIPNADSWNMMIFYAPYYVSNGSVLTFNADDKKGEVTNFYYEPDYRRSSDYKPGDFEYSIRHRAKHFVYKDKVIAPHQTKYDYHGEIILTYNIKENKMTDLLEFEDKDFKMIVADANQDGIIRGSGYSRSDKSFMAFEYNPYNEKLTMSTKFQHSGVRFSDYNYGKTIAYGDWLIAGIGADPWRLVGYNFKTSKWRLFKEIPGLGDHKTIIPKKQEDGTVYVFTKDQNNLEKAYIFDGENFYETKAYGNDGPNKYIHPLIRKYPTLAGQGTNTWYYPDFKADDMNIVPPVLDKGKSMPDHDNINRIHYVYKDDVQIMEQQMQADKGVFNLVGSTGDYLFGAAKNYGEHIFYNKKTGESKYFKGDNISLYSMKAIGDKVYMAGYPNFRLYEYDLKTMTQTDIGSFQKEVHTHRPFAGIEKGYDANIYFSGRYYRNRDNGTGGLAWYNPETKEKFGVEIDIYEPYWMTSISNGTHMVMSCKASDDTDPALLTFNVEDKNMTAHIIKDFYPGTIVGVNDEIIGYGYLSDVAIIYKMNPLTEAFDWIYEVPKKPVTSLSHVRSNEYICLYDGQDYVYFNMEGYLVKIDIYTGEPTVLGKLPNVSQIEMTQDGKLIQAGYGGFVELILPE